MAMTNVITGMIAMGVIFCYIAVLKAMHFSGIEIKVCAIPFVISFLGMVFTFIYFKG